MSSTAVGIRKLKDHLSEYVHRARDGEEFLITHHGEVVAELRPRARKSAPPIHPGISQMVSLGIARGETLNDPTLYSPPGITLSSGSVQELLDEERGDR